MKFVYALMSSGQSLLLHETMLDKVKEFTARQTENPIPFLTAADSGIIYITPKEVIMFYLSTPENRKTDFAWRNQLELEMKNERRQDLFHHRYRVRYGNE